MVTISLGERRKMIEREIKKKKTIDGFRGQNNILTADPVGRRRL